MLNSEGETAFIGEVSGPNVAVSRGIWSEGGGNLHLVAREGLPAPGTDPGTNFGSFRAPVLNGLGHLAFQANLAGPGGNTGIWVEGPDGLELVVRSRQEFEVAPGDIRTIQQLGVYGRSGNEDGRRSGFNDFGHLVFRASFTDGTSGIFVADLTAIPEPVSAVLMLMAAAGFSARNRRRHAMAPFTINHPCAL